jgi:glycosyltransferase involved in cell wall biosynthesis
MLLFGSLTARKGVIELIEAIRHLPAEAARRSSIVLAGSLHADVRERVETSLARLRQESSAQVILHNAYLPHSEVQNLIGAADLVLLPYQRHAGSSGVLIRAAAAKRPVLTQDYGVLADEVREHCLGRVVDTTDPTAIATGITCFLEDPLKGFDPVRAYAFAAANSLDAYLDVLFGHLFATESANDTPPLRFERL